MKVNGRHLSDGVVFLVIVLIIIKLVLIGLFLVQTGALSLPNFEVEEPKKEKKKRGAATPRRHYTL